MKGLRLSIGLLLAVSVVTIACSKSQVVIALNAFVISVDAAVPVAQSTGNQALVDYLTLASTVAQQSAATLLNGSSTRSDVLAIIQELTQVVQVNPSIFNGLSSSQKIIIQTVATAASALIIVLQSTLPVSKGVNVDSKITWRLSISDKNIVKKNLNLAMSDRVKLRGK